MSTNDDIDPVRWRLFRSHQDDQPCVICVQSFDLYDIDVDRFLTDDEYDSELEAEAALSTWATAQVLAAHRALEVAKASVVDAEARVTAAWAEATEVVTR